MALVVNPRTPHPLAAAIAISFFFLGTKTSRCKSRCDGRTYKKLQS
jgi:hypothetical protein